MAQYSQPAELTVSTPPTVHTVATPPATQYIITPPATQYVSTPPAVPPIGTPPAVYAAGTPETQPVVYVVGTQPMAVAPMQVLGGNRNSQNRPLGPDGKRYWSYGLFDCFNSIGTFCLAWWVPCIAYSQNKQRLRNLQTNGVPLPGGGDALDGECCVYCGLLCCGVGWALQIGPRAEIRNRYNIRGSGGVDCLSSYFCTPCALTQERREIELEEFSISGPKQQ